MDRGPFAALFVVVVFIGTCFFIYSLAQHSEMQRETSQKLEEAEKERVLSQIVPAVYETEVRFEICERPEVLEKWKKDIMAGIETCCRKYHARIFREVTVVDPYDADTVTFMVTAEKPES